MCSHQLSREVDKDLYAKEYVELILPLHPLDPHPLSLHHLILRLLRHILPLLQ